MRKSLICFLLFWSGAVFAGGIDKVVLQATNVPLTATARTVISSKITGYINRLDLLFANSTSTVNLTVSSSNSLSTAITTYTTAFTSTNISLNFTNHAQRVCVLNEAVYLTCTNAAYSNQNVTAILFFDRP